jgi:peptidylprolyl isomerase
VRPRLVLVAALVAVGALGFTTAVTWAAEEPPDPRHPPAAATVHQEGLASLVLEAGSGERMPTADDHVKVRFRQWSPEGELVKDTGELGRSVVIPVARAIPGWYEILPQMREGETRRLWLSPDMMRSGRGSVPAGPVVFDLELVEVIPPPVAPENVAAPPAEAVEEGGVHSLVLSAGAGTEHPGRRDRVRVHYTGWTTGGELVDSSILRGEPSEFGLDQVIAGWTRGLRLMVEGERRRLWIPGRLAYDGEEGKPQGMLVFDIELLEIVE